MEHADESIVRTAAGTAHGAAGLSRTELVRLLEHPEALVWRHFDRPVKISHECLLVEAELPLGCGSIQVAYKQFRPRGWWKSLLGRFRRSRAMRGWVLGQSLRARQIATPRPLAALEPCDGWLFRTSYLATEWIAGAENLHLYGWRLAGDPLEKRLREASRCAVSLGRLLGRMHAMHVSHRDLKWANLLAVPSRDQVAVYLVDLDGAQLGRRPSFRRRAADLGRLAVGLEAHGWVTRTVCCRFLRAYLQASLPESVSWKRLWRDVARRARKDARRKRRRRESVL